MNGPLPESVSARPAALIAATSVLNEPFFAATSTTVPSTGSMTVSITWMTPLEHAMSVAVTVAPSTVTFALSTLMSTRWPFTVPAYFILTTSAACTEPGTT